MILKVIQAHKWLDVIDLEIILSRNSHKLDCTAICINKKCTRH